MLFETTARIIPFDAAMLSRTPFFDNVERERVIASTSIIPEKKLAKNTPFVP